MSAGPEGKAVRGARQGPRGTLVFHHNGIGDYVMTLPALRLIQRSAPRPVHLVHGDGAGSFLYREIAVAERTSVPFSPGLFAHRFDPDAVPLQGRYETFVSLSTWDGPEVRALAMRSRAQTTIGFFPWYDWRLEQEGLHDIARLFALALPFAPRERLLNFARPPRVPPRTRDLRVSLVPRSHRLLVVHADTRVEKMWPRERYDAVLSAFLAANDGWCVAVLGIDAALLRRALATGHVIPVGAVSLAEAIRLVAKADLFLGIDSCMLHVADLCRVPGVALFGPTRSEQFGYFLTDGSKNLQVDGALSDLPPREVAAALEEVRGRVQR